MKMRKLYPVLAAAVFALSIVKPRTSNNPLDRKGKEGTVKEEAPDPQAEEK
jgi:hypothetical protein